MKINNVLATFLRDLRIRIGTTLILIASLAALTAPARAFELFAEAKLRNPMGHEVGRAWFIQQWDGNVNIQIRVQDLPAGFHGFHVHAVGKCERGSDGPPAVADFASAGGHLDLGPKDDHGNHSGDLPVLLVNSDKEGNARFNTDRFTVADLFDKVDGTALIIHANADNYANIPPRYSSNIGEGPGPDAMTKLAGDSGGRIACGVIEKVILRR